MLESQNERVMHPKAKRLLDAAEPWKSEGAMVPKIKIYAGRIGCIKGFGRMIISGTELDRIFVDAKQYE
jgi:hypothetical protein